MAKSKGWPDARIVVVIGLYCDEDNWEDYTAYGVAVPATNARHLLFINAGGTVAIDKGVTYVNPYSAMENDGGTGPDGRHPDDYAHAVIADEVISQIGAL